MACLTAARALDRPGGLHPGQTVLIHHAAGATGLVALGLARRAGVRVVATADSPGRRALLRDLGAELVLAPDDPALASRVRESTGGRGVDAVISPGPGADPLRDVDLLVPGGSFVRLGSGDQSENRSLPLGSLAGDLSYRALDLRSASDAYGLAGEFRALTRRLADGERPALPYVALPVDQVADAFELLRHGRQPCRVVLTFDDRLPRAEALLRTPRLDPAGAYVVTGDLAGFGAATARWLAAAGARRLLLVGRRGIDTPGAPELLAELAELGAHATAHAVDAADQAAMDAVLDDARRAGHPPRGVVHCAMVLRDRPALDLDTATDLEVLTPKLVGARVLDSLTRHDALDFFVVYSSVSTLVGNIRQSAYVAANAAMEALVVERRQAGLPALAIQWGAIAETGVAARTGLTEALERLGHFPLGPDEALAALADTLCDDGPDRPAVITIARADWRRTRRVYPIADRPRFALVMPDEDAPADAGEDPEIDGRDALRRELSEAGEAEAVAAVERELAALLASVLATTPDRVDPTRRLSQLGLDSLMATELAVTLRRRFDCAVPAVELTGSPGVRHLARRILFLRRRSP